MHEIKLTEEELKEVSVRLFMALCQKVKGHVFTRPNHDTDSVYIDIKKGPVNFECGVFKVSSYVNTYGQIDYDNMVDFMVRPVLRHYKTFVLEHYIKTNRVCPPKEEGVKVQSEP